MLIIMASIFFFLPDFFYNKVVMYHLCGFLLFIGIFLLNQEIVYRNKKGFISDSENSTNKRSIVLLIQAFVYMIPLAVLSYFFFDSLILRIFLYVQIFFCGVLFLDGSYFCIPFSYKIQEVFNENNKFIKAYLTIDCSYDFSCENFSDEILKKSITRKKNS